MEISPMGGELFHVDRWTDRQTDGLEACSQFPQFCECT